MGGNELGGICDSRVKEREGLQNGRETCYGVWGRDRGTAGGGRVEDVKIIIGSDLSIKNILILFGGGFPLMTCFDGSIFRNETTLWSIKFEWSHLCFNFSSFPRFVCSDVFPGEETYLVEPKYSLDGYVIFLQLLHAVLRC